MPKDVSYFSAAISVIFITSRRLSAGTQQNRSAQRFRLLVGDCVLRVFRNHISPPCVTTSSSYATLIFLKGLCASLITTLD